MKQFKYGLTVETALPYDQAIEAVTKALGAEGFGILTEVDVQATLKQKIDVDYSRYKILGACNPHLAYRALQAEQNVGLLLPCNVIVYESGQGSVVSIFEPDLMESITGNAEIGPIAREAKEKLVRALESLE